MKNFEILLSSEQLLLINKALFLLSRSNTDLPLKEQEEVEILLDLTDESQGILQPEGNLNSFIH